jgi:hypothetical protein
MGGTRLESNAASTVGGGSSSAEPGAGEAKSEADLAESGRFAVEPTAPADRELAAVVKAWPALPEAIKAGILAMVRTATGRQQS